MNLQVVATIRQLLYYHDLVIVPQMGAFVAFSQPASVQRTQHSYAPPRKQIQFNVQLQKNDGLLQHSLATLLNMSYADAAREIEKFRQELVFRLRDEGSVALDQLGVFKEDTQGNWQFEADSEANFDLHSYGLTSFYLRPVKPLKHSTGVVVRKYDYRKIATRTLMLTPIVLGLALFSLQLPQSAEQGLARIGISSLWKQSKTISLKESDVPEESAKSLTSITAATYTHYSPFSASEEAFSLADIQLEAHDMLDSLSADFAATQQAFQVTQEKDLEVTPRYFLVAASYAQEEPALRFVNRLQNKGYQAELRSAPNGRFRVCVESHGDKSDALRRLSALRTQIKPDIWLLKE